MSDTDSFIEEVTEEVRRDRLFAVLRKYGWIAILVVVLIVGGAAWNEWRKVQEAAKAQAFGDAIFAALEAETPDAQIDAFSTIDAPNGEAKMIVEFLVSAAHLGKGDGAAAATSLEAIANSSEEIPEIYRQIALFKAVVAQGGNMPVDNRRTLLEAMALPGAPLSLLAQEQLALVDVEEGKVEAAIARLQTVILDAGITPGLRTRASQLIVALGGEQQTVGQ